MDILTTRSIVKGLATYIPGLYAQRKLATGGTTNSRYCYSVWLRHLALIDEHGLNTAPEVIAELGPGDSLGTGLAGILTGANAYYGFDVVEYARTSRNAIICEELVELFSRREPVPDNAEFPEVEPALRSYEFPSHILSENRLSKTLRPERVAELRIAIAGGSGHNGLVVEYRSPWSEPDVISPATVDLVFSQAVLEHVDDLRHTYAALFKWLKPGGVMSHQIDFRSHSMSRAWNGHWTFSDPVWKIIVGRRAYLLNREPCSVHLDLMRVAGFKVVAVQRVQTDSDVRRDQLAPRFRSLSEEDLTTRSAYVLAVKP
jgi:SAM-dependent methyltransferase